MNLIYPDRMSVLLDRYAVGDARCLVHPGLVHEAQDYRRRAQARLCPLDVGQLTKKLHPAEYHVSLKIDGEFNLLAYSEGEAVLVNPGGTVRAGLPAIDAIADKLTRGSVRQALIAGELYYQRPGQSRSRVHDVSRAARLPESAVDLERLQFAAFDVIESRARHFREVMPDFPERFAWLKSIGGLPVVESFWLKDSEEIRTAVQRWIDLGHEGAVLRSDVGGSFKVKKRHTLDVVVIGFTEGTDERQGMSHDLLVALMRPEGTYHVLGRVGGGFSDEERRAWLSDLRDLAVESDYVEANEGVAYQMVRPQHVIEISVLDLVTENTRGTPVTSMVLDFDRAKADGPAAWHIVRRMPLCALLSPQFVRVRADKQVNATDLRLAQPTALVDVAHADADARQFALAKSKVLRRAVWTKQQKGQTMVRKLVLWATHKAGDGSAFPAYVVHVTDFSPNRKTPLERDIRVSNSVEQMEQLWQELVKEYVLKGWMAA
jgi:hypothetical protein